MQKFFQCLTLLSLLLSFSAQAATQALTLDGDHGRLSAILQLPEQKQSYPLVILCHGFTSHKEVKLLEELADKLEAQGIASLRFDFNGHGQSEGRFEDMTVVNEIEDANLVYEYVRKLPQVTKIALAGHSQGGVVSSMLAGKLGQEKIAALVLLAPAAVLRDDALRGLMFNHHYDAINPPQSVDLKLPDHPDYRLGINYIRSAQSLPIYETAQRYSGPVLIIQGTHDTVVPYTYAQRYHYGYASSTLRLLEGADHGFHQHTLQATALAADFLDEILK